MSQDRIKRIKEVPFFMVENLLIDNGSFLSDSELRLYLILCRYGNTTGSAIPSYQTLAMKMNKTKRSIMRIMDSLIEKKLITKEARFDKGGNPTSNLYIINDLEEVVTPMTLGGSDTHDTRGSDTHDTRVVTPVSPNKESLIKKGFINKSFSPSVQCKEKKEKRKDRQIDVLYKNLEIDRFLEEKLWEESLVKILYSNIKEMWYNKITRISGNEVDREYIRSILLNLVAKDFDQILSKYIEATLNDNIKRPKQYLQTIIYNLNFESELNKYNKNARKY